MSWMLLLGLLAQAAPQDRVAALVDGHPIMLSEVREALLMMVPQPLLAQADPRTVDSLEKVVLQELVKRKILYLEAKKDTTIQVTDEEVEDNLNAQIQELEKQFGREQLDEMLRQNNTSREQLKDLYRDRVREDLLVQKFVQTRIAPKITITPDELKAFYERVKDTLRQPAEVRLYQIVVLVKPSSEALAVTARKARKVYDQIVKGAISFEEAARQYSDDRASAEKGGLVGEVPRSGLYELLPDTLADKILKAQPGTVLPPQQLPLGYALFRVDTLTGESVVLRYIMFRAEQTVQDTLRARKRAQEIVARIRKGESFAKLALKYSDDHATRDLGGDAGWKRLDLLPPEVATVVEKLKPGEVSDPIFYEGAFWVFMVKEKRGGEIPPFEQVQSQLHQILFGRKLQAAVDSFVEKVRDRHRVEIKL